MKNDVSILQQKGLALLQELIAIPSFSKEEDKTADAIVAFLEREGVKVQRQQNNVWATGKHFDPAKPSLLLNSHHDTVKPNPGYTLDPFTAQIKDGRLYGLGSNDAGGCLVSLIAAFLFFYDRMDGAYNIVLAATAEEEISGRNGIEALLTDKDFIDATGGAFQPAQLHPHTGALVGEPTLLNLAVAEKGLLVLDAVAHGIAGHAAREEGENALYKAMDDINWFRTYRFRKESPTLGAVKMSVTSVQTSNTAHNIVPAECKFVADIRVTDAYTHEELLGIIRDAVKCEVTPRSMRMRATVIDASHPLVQSGLAGGGSIYGSPTSSDKALMSFPALKCGPGDSVRSHTADEFIFLHEIAAGVQWYIDLIGRVMQHDL